MARPFASLLLACLIGRAAHAQCEPSAAVGKTLELRHQAFQLTLPRREIAAREAAILAQGLAENPGDFFLLRLEIPELNGGEKDRWLAANQSLIDQHPDQPVYVLLRALGLMGHDTPAAIALLEGLEAANPPLSRAPLVLAQISSFGKFKDLARAQHEMAAFLQLCPAALDAEALTLVLQLGTTEQVARVAAAVRRRLEASPDPQLSLWPVLWSLEFKGSTSAQQPALRRQVEADVARLAPGPKARDLTWLIFARGAYRTAMNSPQVEKLEAEILRRFSTSKTAMRIVQERWRREHPPGSWQREEDAPASFRRAQLAAAEQWRRQWPDEPEVLRSRFDALAALPETAPAEIASAADELLAAYAKDPYFYSIPPLEFRVAAALDRFKVRLERVPDLVSTGYSAYLARHRSELLDDRLDDASRVEDEREPLFVAAYRAQILLDDYSATGQPEKAEALDVELAGLSAAGSLQAEIFALRAQAAELSGRKLDALLLARAALDGGIADSRLLRRKESTADTVERLWRELGGTPSSHALLAKPKVSEVLESSWTRPQNPLPDFALSDLEGKRWKLSALAGKAVLVNVWATWCGPCRAEHPEFQKLYEKLKNRPDIVVLSFNVDDDQSKIEPYLTENRYTFPVVPAREIVDAVVPTLGIPRNWFIDPRGKLRWEQVGFGGDSKWQERVIEKLEETLKPE